MTYFLVFEKGSVFGKITESFPQCVGKNRLNRYKKMLKKGLAFFAKKAYS